MTQEPRPTIRGTALRGARGQRSVWGRVSTGAIAALAGFMGVLSALAATGGDLRSDRIASLRELVVSQTARSEQLRAEANQLRTEVEQLGAAQTGTEGLKDELAKSGMAASTVAVSGPGVKVVLSDAPPDVKPAGVDDDALVVHQQDIQAVANALWRGGAEAVSIQGQRVISTTGIKCVGNSVVLHGVPYTPPYVIQAIGDVASLEAALNSSPHLVIYRQYVDSYGLGYQQFRSEKLDLPAYEGAIGLNHAKAIN